MAPLPLPRPLGGFLEAGAGALAAAAAAAAVGADVDGAAAVQLVLMCMCCGLQVAHGWGAASGAWLLLVWHQGVLGQCHELLLVEGALLQLAMQLSASPAASEGSMHIGTSLQPLVFSFCSIQSCCSTCHNFCNV